jgi:hypothetical protein
MFTWDNLGRMHEDCPDSILVYVGYHGLIEVLVFLEHLVGSEWIYGLA